MGANPDNPPDKPSKRGKPRWIFVILGVLAGFIYGYTGAMGENQKHSTAFVRARISSPRL